MGENSGPKNRSANKKIKEFKNIFDMVKWVQLFKILQERTMSPIFLKTILFIYRNQSCTVKWNGSYSNKFIVSNGVRQWAVSSPPLFSVYIDGLFS